MKKTLITNNFSKEELFNYIQTKVGDFDFTHANSITVSLDDFIANQTKAVPDIHVKITPEAYIKTMSLVGSFDKELAWHGTVEQQNDTFTITDVFMYPQRVTGITADADEALYTPWIRAQGEKINSIRMQGHSHVNMGVTPSGTDLNYYKDLLDQVNDYYIFIIMNKSQLTHIRVYDKVNNILYTDIPLELAMTDGSLNLKTWNDTQMKQVQQTVYQATPAYTGLQQSRAVKERDAYDTYFYRQGD